ncbi:hypothetical protein AABB24_037018, partial [Solanum stoloniferum]
LSLPFPKELFTLPIHSLSQKGPSPLSHLLWREQEVTSVSSPPIFLFFPVALLSPFPRLLFLPSCPASNEEGRASSRLQRVTRRVPPPPRVPLVFSSPASSHEDDNDKPADPADAGKKQQQPARSQVTSSRRDPR